MAKVKQEEKEELLTSDASLLHWTEPEREVKLLERQDRDSGNIKSEIEDGVSDGELDLLEDFDESNMFSKSKTDKNEKIHVNASESTDFESTTSLRQKEVGKKQKY